MFLCQTLPMPTTDLLPRRFVQAMHFRQPSVCGRAFARVRGGAVSMRFPRRVGAWLVGLLLLLHAGLQAYDASRMLSAAQTHGPRAVQSVRALQTALAQAAGLNDSGRLQTVNRFYNQTVEFVDDIAGWGQIDYWASPMEMLGKGVGDCEDYALAKYFALTTIGMPASQLRVVYVRALQGGASVAHMVLAYYPSPGAEPFILDNLIDEIRAASARPDLTPVFSFNTEGLWQGVGSQSAGDPTAKLSRWRDYLLKVRAEGF